MDSEDEIGQLSGGNDRVGGAQDDEFDSSPRPAKRRRTAAAASKKTKQPSTRKMPTSRTSKTKKKPTEEDSIVDDEENAFDPPAPVVRINRNSRKRAQVNSDEDIIDESEEIPGKSVKSKRKTKTRASIDPDAEDFELDEDDFVKPKKPKHRIHTPTVQDFLPEKFLDEEPPASSAPWSLRGPIWRKDAVTSVAARQPPPPVRPTPMPVGGRLSSESPRTGVATGSTFSNGRPNGVSVRPTTINSARVNPPPQPPSVHATTSRPNVQHISPSALMSKPPIKVPEPWETGDDSDDVDIEELMLLETDAPPTRIANTSAITPSTNTLSETVRPQSVAPTVDITDELADLPSDAFDSDHSSPFKATDGPIYVSSQSQPRAQKPNAAAPKSGLRQTTLFGGTVQPISAASQANKRAAWPMATQKEPATHHKLVEEAIKTWVYPTNLGTIRDYQYNIVARGLFHNLLVALPTGLGKTFIAATIMLNWFRWTQSGQIVFVAPTKPLVAQQIDACFHIVGIPRSETVMLTGTTPPGLRAEEWKTKRVFFMTPQTIINDLKTGLCDPKRIVLVVVDEAHRATGGYAYVEVIKFIRRFNESFRVLALTATPGATVDAVQQVIDGLDISRVEIRTETSLDIRQYVHSREIDSVKFDYSEEQQVIMELASNAIRPVLNKLAGVNAYWNRDPMKLTAYSCTMAQRQWYGSDAGKKATAPIKAMVSSIFRVLASLGHSVSLLKFHGIGPFYQGMTTFRNNVDGGQMKGKYGTQIRDDENFVKMMNMMQTWTRNPDFLGHPKLEYLRSVVLNHFLDAGEGRVVQGAAPSATRIMIFAHWRDSAEEIVRVLKRNEPMIRPHVFVGQADAKGSEGMGQKRQLEVIKEFKEGKYNTLVATSIGEEGLDIGEVDLIVCYDASSSPIRMLQRMGRTGRKRKGNIVLLLMRDKEESDFEKAKDNYEKMQGMIASGDQFNFHDDRSRRIIPREVQPVVDKRVVEIPAENSQAELPEPSRRKRVPKMPPKKFHMPDNVRTGFVKASRMDEDDDEEETAAPRSKAKPKKSTITGKAKGPIPEPEPAPLPFAEDVFLNKVQERELERKYQYVQDDDDGIPTVAAPRLDKFTNSFPGATRYIKHGQSVANIATLMQRLRKVNENTIQSYKDNFHPSDLEGDVSELLGEPTIEAPTTTTTDLPTAKAPGSRPKKSAAKKAKAPKAASTTKTPKARAAPARKNARERKDSSDMEGASSSPEPTPANMRIATQGIDLGSEDTAGEEDEEQPDSELEDFVVGSDAPIEFVSSSLPQTQTQTQGVVRAGAGVVLSDVSEVEVESSEEDGRGHDAVVRKRGRRQVVEDDSDE